MNPSGGAFFAAQEPCDLTAGLLLSDGGDRVSSVPGAGPFYAESGGTVSLSGWEMAKNLKKTH